MLNKITLDCHIEKSYLRYRNVNLLSLLCSIASLTKINAKLFTSKLYLRYYGFLLLQSSLNKIIKSLTNSDSLNKLGQLSWRLEPSEESECKGKFTHFNNFYFSSLHPHHRKKRASLMELLGRKHLFETSDWDWAAMIATNFPSIMWHFGIILWLLNKVSLLYICFRNTN